MGKVTKVFNDTEAVIELKQGSANVFHLLYSLPSGKTYNIKVDESATYREYWCAVQPVKSSNTTAAADRVVFSSDDCTEYSKVRIYKDSDGKYAWRGTELRGTWMNTPVTPKDPTPDSNEVGSTSKPTVPSRAPDPVHDAKPLTWFQRVFKKN